MKENLKKIVLYEKSYEISKIILVLLTSVLFLKFARVDHVFVKSFFITVFSFVPIIGAGVYFIPAIILNLLESNTLYLAMYAWLFLAVICIDRILYSVFYDFPFDYSPISYVIMGMILYLIFGKYILLVFALSVCAVTVYNNYNKYKKTKVFYKKATFNFIDLKQIIQEK
ncbi:MAG: hypothetical protein E6190_02570 [Finegoldia magna]|uniref:hypothetical protein n=1 Tax=Finegoldia magna TaxID=1260 RepID=UPI002903C7AE|nr:hypothetical protein [Finegoldia magna]MDU3124992.1 hypothetical protein [Finegoldia magna]MDU5214563.1 hypothetical protein [Finegoldia magna]MDU5237304.1 hypothetical protein [Finegoldia magna]